MKLIKNLNQSASTFAGKQKNFVEFTFRPSPKTDDNGTQLTPQQRYYVIRPLSFENEKFGRTDYPFIIRNEHIFVQRDADNKVVSVEKITCPTTAWASDRLRKQGEPIGKGYCPICAYSFEKNGEAWANRGHIDKVAAKLAQETQCVWAAYIPVYIVSDPHFPKNNKHLRVLRIAARSGSKEDRKLAQDTFQRIINKLEECMNAGINVFNGDEGANLWVLCESVKKNHLDKNGNPSINKKTGKPYEYTSWDITDIRMGTKKLYAYPDITDEAIDELEFDETYNVAATRASLDTFLRKNWLDIGASDSDAFEAGELPDADFEAPSDKQTVESKDDESDGFDTVADEDNIEHGDEPSDDISEDEQVEEESAASVISSIIGKKPVASAPLKRPAAPQKTVAKSMSLPKNTEKIREETVSEAGFDDSDLPF